MTELKCSVKELITTLGIEAHEAINLPCREMIGRQAHLDFRGTYPEAEYEVTLRCDYRRYAGFILRLRGRIDILDQENDAVKIVEFKTVAIPGFIYQDQKKEIARKLGLQAQIYAYMLGKGDSEKSGRKLKCEIVLHNLADRTMDFFPVEPSDSCVEKAFDRYIEIWCNERKNSEEEYKRRRQISEVFEWPYESFRVGQEDIIQSVEKSFADMANLMIQAPPGSGKTMAILMPTLKTAFANGGQVYYATAKTGGRNPILTAVEKIFVSGLKFRVLVLSARNAVCEVSDDDERCSSDGCEFYCSLHRRVYFDRLLESAPDSGIMDIEEIRELSENLGICPVKLSRELLKWADLVTGDYNYIFDPVVKLSLFKSTVEINWWLLIDEAHNLIERSRNNYSVVVMRSLVNVCLNLIISESWRKIETDVYDEIVSSLEEIGEIMDFLLDHYSGEDIFPVEIDTMKWSEATWRFNLAMADYLSVSFGRIDDEVVDALWELFSAFEVFNLTLDSDREAFLHYAIHSNSAVGVACIDPAVFLSDAFRIFRQVTVFSATLQPFGYHVEALGLTAKPVETIDAWEFLRSDQRMIALVNGIDTRYRLRQKQIGKITSGILQLIGLKRGVYLVFLPSFEFINIISDRLKSSIRKHNTLVSDDAGQINLYIQTANSTEADRRQIVDAFTDPDGSAIILAVAGGQLAEAIDYQGGVCRGAVIISPCLPPPDYWRETLRAYWDSRGEDGYEVAYVYPGIRKVIQAAGRVIRNTEDRGVILLMGDRFCQHPYFDLLPGDWQEALSSDQNDWLQQVQAFWKSQ